MILNPRKKKKVNASCLRVRHDLVTKHKSNANITWGRIKASSVWEKWTKSTYFMIRNSQPPNMGRKLVTPAGHHPQNQEIHVAVPWSCGHVSGCAQLLSHIRLFAALWTAGCRAPLSKAFFRKEYRSGLPFPPPEDLPDLGIKPMSLALAGRIFTTGPHGKPCKWLENKWETPMDKLGKNIWVMGRNKFKRTS